MPKIQAQNIPVRISRSDKQLVLAAPLAGLEPEDITIAIDGRNVTIEGKERGPRQHGLDLIEAEWRIGPYLRSIVLPQPVDGGLTNATYGNGVLVLKMPTAASADLPARAQFSLETVGLGRGERVGHVGHGLTPVSTV
jgi:HSP20 family protein